MGSSRTEKKKRNRRKRKKAKELGMTLEKYNSYLEKLEEDHKREIQRAAYPPFDIEVKGVTWHVTSHAVQRMQERDFSREMLISLLEIAPEREDREEPKKVTLGRYYNIVVHHNRVVTVSKSEELLKKVLGSN